MVRKSWLPLLLCLVTVMPAHAFLEHRFIYFPESTYQATPADVGLAYEEVHFTAADGTPLYGWFVPGEPGQPVVVFCIGNAGNISQRVDNLAWLHRLGVGTFIFDYRGYGRSGGVTSEEGTYADLRGALAWLSGHGVNPDRIILFGRSLGAAVALQVALEQPPAGLVMESPFTSIAAMGWAHYPLLYLLAGWLVGARYQNLAKIARLQSPLLLIHGEQDTICPPDMARELFTRAQVSKALVWIPQADHNETFLLGGEIYRRGWIRFLDGVRAPTSPVPVPP
jgi:fermentation-respiration switch protein FrsA (DUF1100 family)